MEYKIRTESYEHAKEVIRVLYKLGYAWNSKNEDYVPLSDKVYIYTYEDKEMYWGGDENGFRRDDKPEITLKQLKDKLMKKPNTRPKDYTNCHPVIAEALNQGLEIECIVKDNNKNERVFISEYRACCNSPYLEKCDKLTAFLHKDCEPYYPPRLKPFPDLIKTLVDSGYRPNTQGEWINKSGSGFAARMISAAAKGEMLEGTDYPQEWLEQ